MFLHYCRTDFKKLGLHRRAMSALLYTIPDRAVYKKWKNTPAAMGKQLKKHLVLRNPTAVPQRVFICTPTTAHFELVPVGTRRPDAKGTIPPSVTCHACGWVCLQCLSTLIVRAPLDCAIGGGRPHGL